MSYLRRKMEIARGAAKQSFPKKGKPMEKKLKSIPIPKMVPKDNKPFDKKMPLLKKKLKQMPKQKESVPAFMKPGYEPGSIMRGYTKYA